MVKLFYCLPWSTFSYCHPLANGDMMGGGHILKSDYIPTESASAKQQQFDCMLSAVRGRKSSAQTEIKWRTEMPQNL